MAQSTRYRSEQHHRRAAWELPVTLRLADDADIRALEHVAQLDSCPLPPGPHLVAERDRRVEAAISLATGELIADPFRRTTELCDLLRCHAGEVRVQPEVAPTAPLAPRPSLWMRGGSEVLAEEQPV
jgi:hypothetical protein